MITYDQEMQFIGMVEDEVGGLIADGLLPNCENGCGGTDLEEVGAYTHALRVHFGWRYPDADGIRDCEPDYDTIIPAFRAMPRLEKARIVREAHGLSPLAGQVATISHPSITEGE